MENFKSRENRATVLITDYCFNILLNRIIKRFKDKNQEHKAAIGKVSQLFGFGNYNTNLPSLAQDLEELSGGFINGKYLYDKSRELQIGKPVLKLNGYYKTVLFQYVGYQSIEDFTQNAIEDAIEKEKQLELLDHLSNDKVLYYVSYHFGEYKQVVKSQVVVSNNWKNIQYTYLYPQQDGTFKSFSYHGISKQRADILHIYTKTLMDGKMVDGGESILYVGHSDPSVNEFMLGVYSAFDINNRVIAGKVIKEKCKTKEEMMTKSMSRKTPAYIVQELRNLRIENDGTIPNNALEISAKSPYSITYDKIPGDYKFTLAQGSHTTGDFSFSIDKDTFRLTSLTEGILINKDHFELIQNGTVIQFSFQLTGIALFTRLEAFIKTYYLNNSHQEIMGVFSGLDIENRLINGELIIDFKPA